MGLLIVAYNKITEANLLSFFFGQKRTYCLYKPWGWERESMLVKHASIFAAIVDIDLSGMKPEI